MFRLVALLLAVLLPLQFAWGVAAAYCQHEPTTQAAHVGHHAHEHQAGSQAEAKKPAAAKLMADSDCTACHATCSAIGCEAVAGVEGLVLTGRLAVPLLDAYASAPGRAPDRPQWLRLA